MGRTLKRRLLKLLIALISLSALALIFGCEADKAVDKESPEVQAKRVAHFSVRARRLGDQLAKHIVFQAQEINMLDPRSERAKSSRRARQLVDQITDDPTPISPKPAPEEPASEKPAR